jgi:hypothetical protein
MIEIIDEPYTGDDCADYNLRRSKPVCCFRSRLGGRMEALKSLAGSR